MKYIFTISFFLISLNLFATNYYVATTGSDANPGTIVSPFKTWQKGASVLVAGDTCFIRGGTYTSQLAPGASDWICTITGRNGTSVNPIVITNYQSEVPIFDFAGFLQLNNTTAIRMNTCSWIHFKGLKVRNLKQNPANGNIVAGWQMNDSHDIIMEECEVLSIGGAGFRNTTGCNNFTYINCDAIGCADSISTGGGAYGNADGFDANVGTTSYTGCRAWWNSDDGFDCFGNDAIVTYTNCWAFRNGYVPFTFINPGVQADGMGFKWGNINTSQPNSIRRTYTQCVSFQNKAWGFDQNAAVCLAQFWNNTSWKNVLGGWATGYGINPREANIFRNNCSFQDPIVISDQANLNMANNSWQVAVPVAASFASLDTTGVSGPRVNGVLPILAFLHLSSNSNQIDKGQNVGLPFCPTAPDLGAYEFCPTIPALTVSPNFTAILCFGGTSIITVGVAGGQPPYQYSINGGAFGSSNIFSGLVAGTYLISVRDALGATGSQNAFIAQPSQITISQVSGTITVNGGSTTTTVTTGGGTGTVTSKRYSLDGSAFQVSNVFTGVLAGTHTITVRDSMSCTNTLTYTLAQPAVLNLSAAATTNPLTCFGNTTTITATATGGTTPYQYQINGGAFQSATTFTGRGVGTYTITVRDAAGVLKTTTVTITAPTQITITESHTVIVANGGTSTITFTAGGGTGAKTYSLDGVTFQASNVFAGKVAGNYTVTVKDVNNCTNTFSFTITQPSALNVSALATVNPLLCPGNTTSIIVTATGGTTPYQYSINGGAFQVSNTFTNRGVGTYTLTVRDAANVTNTTTLTITQPAQITISESHTAIAINGGVSTLTVTAGGGTGSKTYSINGTTFQASNVFAGVVAGTYTITVKDANNCINTLITTITQPTALIVTPAITTAIACNGSTGVITVAASGGTAPYTYRQGTTGNFGASNLFTVLSGTYQYFVRDAGGAIVSASITISQPTIIAVTVNAGPVAPATVTVTATGGVGTLNYKLDNGSYQASNTFTGVTSGNHTITVRDANLCTQAKVFNVGVPLSINLVVGTILCNGGTTTVVITANGGVAPYHGTGTFTRGAGTWTFNVNDGSGAQIDTTIVISQPLAIIISISTGTIAVNGGSTTATITATNGVGTKNYKLDNGSFQPSNSFSGVLAGNHTVTVRDGNGCLATQAFVLTQPGVLGISLVTGTAINCNGGNTTVTLTGNGGTTPFTYGKNGVFQAAQLFSNITAGTYTFSVKDAFNNQKDTIITISQPTALTLSISTGTIAVNGGTTTVTGVGAGGTGGLTYNIDGGSFQGSGTFNNITAGTHTVVVKDANSCTTFNTFSIIQPGVLIIGISVAGSLSCYNDSTNVTVTGTGGTTPYAGTGVFNKHAGTYTFTITDAFGARADTIITINQPLQITISVIIGTIAVNGGTTTVNASATGGTGSLQYSLDGGPYQGSGSFSGVSAGQHFVTVKDANNCTNTNIFSITQPGALFISVVVGLDSLACNGDSTSLTVTANGGTSPYTGTGTFTVAGGTYTITVTDAFGAVHDTIITIFEPAKIAVIAIFAGTITQNGGTTTVVVSAIGGTGTLQYSLDGGGYQVSDTLTGVGGGNHTLIIKDANSCTGIFFFNLYQPPAEQYYKVIRGARHRYIQLH